MRDVCISEDSREPAQTRAGSRHRSSPMQLDVILVYGILGFWVVIFSWDPIQPLVTDIILQGYGNIGAFIGAYMHTHIYIYICVYMYMYISYIYVCMYACMCMCICINMYIHI